MGIPLEDRRRFIAALVDACGADDVDIATMFGSPAIRHRGRIVCFLSGDAELIVKLTRQEALDLIEQGRAAPVVMGRRTLREWVVVARADDPADAVEHWRPHALVALEHARRARDGD